MILDSVQNIERYFSLSSKITEGLKFIQQCSSSIGVGNCKVTDDVTAIVSEYKTSPQFTDRFEAHTNTLDIQFPLIGVEVVKYCPLNTLRQISGYEQERDVTYFGESAINSECMIGNGVFAIFFPLEPHHPGLAFGDIPSVIKKLTIKILFSQKEFYKPY